MQITLIKLKYVRIAVKTMTDTVYPYILSTNQTKVLNWCSAPACPLSIPTAIPNCVASDRALLFGPKTVLPELDFELDFELDSDGVGVGVEVGVGGSRTYVLPLTIPQKLNTAVIRLYNRIGTKSRKVYS
jgi:hypothetical protein